MYAASLRFIFMVPFLLAIVALRGNLKPLLREMKARWKAWFGWSFVGFGIMYAPVCFATEFEPGWLVAGTWQVTIIAGTLVAPLFYKETASPEGTIRVRERIHWRSLPMSLVILLGVAFMQWGNAERISASDVWLGIVPIVIAAFAYPLGNRKMMQVCEGRLDAYQRVLGMTLASLPLWIILSAIAFVQDGPPSAGQTVQSLIVAVSSGVIATVLFFAATDMAKGSAQKLAAVEATQSGEVVFALTGELLLLSVALPPALSWLGMLLVVGGMIMHSLVSALPSRKGLQKAVPRGESAGG